MLEGLGGRARCGAARGLVRHRWWHTAVFALGSSGPSSTPSASLVGLLLLVAATGLPLWVVTRWS